MKILRVFLACAVFASIAAGTLDAQLGDTPRTSDGSVGPLAISGSPSSARHCVFGTAANIHSIGWITAGTGYTITFDSDITLSAAVGRMDLEEDDAIAVYGSPELNFTASSSGTMALFVSGNGRAGCYRYKVVIDPPTGAAASAQGTRVTAQRLAKGTRASFGALAFTGAASSAKHCVAGDGVARIHPLGYADQGSVVTVNFSSDFDPIAGVIGVDPVGQAGIYFIDDDSGGSNQPEISFTASRSGNLALYVAGYGGSTGCYRFQSSIEAGSGGDTTPITLTDVAAPLAEAVASEISLALESGTISEASLGPQGFGTLAIATRSCRRAGSVSVRGVTRSGSRYSMSGATATFVGCTFVVRQRTIAINAALALSGQWCPGQGTGTCSQVTVSGAVPIPGLPAPAPVEGPIGISSYAISIGGAGIQQGAPDTAPPPSPDTCPATVSPGSVSIAASGGGFTITVSNIGATCPWTASSGSGHIRLTSAGTGRGPGNASFSVTANTATQSRSGSVNVAGQRVSVTQSGTTPPPVNTNLTGTWTATVSGSSQSNGAYSVSLTQTSSTAVTGQATGLPGLISDSISGTISGTRVTLIETVRVRVSQQGASVTCDETITHTLTVASSRSMSGTWTLSGRCTVSAPGVPTINQNVNDSGRIAFSR